MKHKQYERWILGDEEPLSYKQQQELDAHLKVCKSCRSLRESWNANKQLITQSTAKIPAPGFTNRWQATLARKYQIEKIRNYRLTVFGLVLLAFTSSSIYIYASGSFFRMLANGFTMVSEMVIGLTNGLSAIGYWLNNLPIAVSVVAGYILIGMINSFTIVGMFFLWNLKQKEFTRI